MCTLSIRIVVVLAAGVLSAVPGAQASNVMVADFEAGLPSGWGVTPSGWNTGGAAGVTPTISPQQGAAFARCGAPNIPAEALTGTMQSGPLVVRSATLQWIACGWSAQGGNGVNRFEILNSNQQVVAVVAAPLTDAWTLQTVNLAAAGLAVGSTMYFRAIDGMAASNYAWLAVDAIQFTGVSCLADLDGSGLVDGTDLGLLLGAWGGTGPADLDNSGQVDGTDLGLLLGAWGPCGAANS